MALYFDPSVATTLVPEATDIPSMVKGMVDRFNDGGIPAGVEFPLQPTTTDSLRAIPGVKQNRIASWFDPISYRTEVFLADGGISILGFGGSGSLTAAQAPRFGANNDYITFFGDNWQDGGTPFFQGSGSAGWMWVNHEYMSGERPGIAGGSYVRPIGQMMLLAQANRALGFTTADPFATNWTPADIDDFTKQMKRQLGGSWFRVIKNPSTGMFEIDRSVTARRFDMTSSTLVKVVGHTLASNDTDDKGMTLPSGVINGISQNCAGGTTPWGTVLSAEENTQSGYGDLEPVYDSQNLFLGGSGFDAGANISPPYFAQAYVCPSQGSFCFDNAFSSAGADPFINHSRETQGWVNEIEPERRTDEWYGKNTAGVGHRKLGVLGRARWEAAAIAVDSQFKLIPDQPVTIYATDDRRNGRIYKYVSGSNYTAGMTKAQIRELLSGGGKLYVAHLQDLDFADGEKLTDGGVPKLLPNYTIDKPGAGKWIELSTSSMDIAPNATALGSPTTTVGQALVSQTWNNIGGYPDNDMIRRALHTAANKIGIAELNRPEDIEFNPNDPTGIPTIYVTFTGHGQRTTLRQDGTLAATAAQQGNRRSTSNGGSNKLYGSILAMQEGASNTFTWYFVWFGTNTGEERFRAAAPDNLMIDRQGGVWFGTDGNPSNNSGKADALYYLDLNGANASFGRAFRVMSMPSDAEATGPAITPDMKTIFTAVQHPGESYPSTWPQIR